MNYIYKYIKYKLKYLESTNLNNQIGGRNHFKNTTSIIYTKDQNGIYYFALSRKVPYNSRINSKGQNSGASGTDPKFWGKWGAFGGGIKNNKNTYNAALEEIYGESGFNCMKQKYKKHDLKLKKTININDTIMYIFYLDKNIFFTFYPTIQNNGRYGRAIVGSSYGEIDAVASFNINDMIQLLNKDNTFFLPYFLKSWIYKVIPYFSKKSQTFSNKWKNVWSNITINYEKRKNIFELTPTKKYIFNKNKKPPCNYDIK